MGPGNGSMSLTILKTLKRFPKLANSINYFLFEKSNYLKKLQKKNLKNYDVKWIENFKKLKNSPQFFLEMSFLTPAN